MEYYRELDSSDACDHDVMIAMEMLQSQQEEWCTESPGLFTEEISKLSGWSISDVRKSLRRGVKAKTIEEVPLAYKGSTSKTSHRIVRK